MRAMAATSMVGRTAELKTLLGAFDEGREGRPRAVLIRGEAGVGKTRLVQELLARISTDRRDDDVPLAIAVGQCVDLGPIGVPLGPVRRVLRDLHAEVGAEGLRRAAGSPAVAGALAALVPGLADEQAPPDELGGEFAEAIEVVLENLSATRHVVIVIEDLQWADAATFALLKTLASSLRGRHLTIVATYRSDDIDRFHPLHPVLAELDRTRGIVRIDVRPLSPAEVTEQVSLLTAIEKLDAREVDALAVRSGGIPFLVEELVDLADRGLPDTLRDLVLARYTRLSEPAQIAVRAMAAGGLHVDHDVLTAVAGLDPITLDRALRESIDARVVVADGAGYSFRHALTQEAVDAEMLPSERVRVHRAYAGYLADHRPDDSPDDVSAIAEHWLAARDLSAAFDATVAALRLSRASYAPATSVKLAERLMELWIQVPDAEERAGTTLPSLHLDAAQAWNDLGDAERALRSTNEGLACCADEPLTRAALLRHRFVQVYNTEKVARREDLDAAIALLEPIKTNAALVLHSRVMANIAFIEHGAEAAEHARQAIALAEQSGDDTALAVALAVESWRIADDEDDEERGLEPIERAMTLRVNPAMRAYAGHAHLDLLSRLGQFEEVVAIGEKYHAEAVRAGIERGSGTSIAFSLGTALLAAGRPGEAVRYIQRARLLSERISRANADRLLAIHHAWNDEPMSRAAVLEADRASIREFREVHPEKRHWWAIERAEAVLTLDQDAASAAEGREALAEVLDALADEAAVTRRHAAVAAALLVATGAPAEPADVERLLAAVDSWPSRPPVPVYAEFVRSAIDRDATPADRVARWAGLLEELGDGAMPIWHRHMAELFLAQALLSAGERDKAAGVLERLAAEAPGHGAARVARWASETAAKAGLIAGTGLDATQLMGLTPREAQVLELIAEGLTNTQIGQRLFISPKTASVHVSAILTKVGAANRAEAAALYAARSQA
jgi:DNA-binding CsgD family transcriptional regulator/tetratricopeptide (TPR) repeat protein